MFKAVLAALVALLFIVILNKAKNATALKQERNYYPYAKKYLLSVAEYRFYKVLKEQCDEADLLICPKVRMEDFLTVTDGQNRAKYRGRIKSRHIDFIICNADLYMLAGLELDDSSHNSLSAQETDRFKDNVFQAIGLPLYRIAAEPRYYPERIAEMLADLLQQAA